MVGPTSEPDSRAAEPPEDAHAALTRVVFTGRLLSLPRREAIALVREHGGVVVSSVSRRTTMLVVGQGGWPLLDDGRVSQPLLRAENLRDAGEPIRIASEREFLQEVGRADPGPSLGKSFSIDRVERLLGVSPTVLLRWEAMGLISSEGGRYDFQDLVSLRTIADLVGRGVAPEVIARSVHGLAGVLTDVARPLAQLKLVAGSGELLAEVGDALLAPDGQLMINFEVPPAEPRDALRLDAEQDTWSADAWFEHASEAEAEGLLELAADAYRAALEQRPEFAVAHFNRGNVLRGLDRLDDAAAHFQRAVEVEPTLAAAWYNLADILEQGGATDAAITCLDQALGAQPGFADAHYNLALLYERRKDRRRAEVHWRSYLRMDPGSEWADHARRRLAEIVGSISG